MSNKSNIHLLLPCAGIGSRAAASDGNIAIPKQYAQLAGKPLVQHTIEAALSAKGIAGVWLVLSAEDAHFDTLSIHTLSAAAGRLHVLRCGGKTRAHTVANGLQAMRSADIDADDWVLVHDAARCMVQAAWIEQLIESVLELQAEGGLLALPLPDTLKQASGHGDSKAQHVQQTLSREDKWLAQTPQMFRVGQLQQALATPNDRITDEASAMEQMGCQPLLVRGHSHNFKVTYPEDFALAEAVLASRTD